MSAGRQSVDLLVINARQVVCVGPGPRRGTQQASLDVIEDGGVAVRGDRIVAVGPSADIECAYTAERSLDASGQVVLPGLVDCHTHPIFAGVRDDEYALRLSGASLTDIARRGGGIKRTVALSRAASDEVLLHTLQQRFAAMLASGTTTVEAKSGYGQTLEQELRHLNLIDRAAAATPLTVVPTLLGAHIVPPEFAGDPTAYAREVREVMLPAAAAQGIARFNDASCEPGYFSRSDCAEVLRAGSRLGLGARLHVDNWAPGGGWETAAACGAIAADHLTFTPDEEIDRVGATETIAVLVPVAELYYFSERRANARRLIDTGVAVALASDFCSSVHGLALSRALSLAAAWFRLTPEEVLTGVTINAAHALGLGHEVGSLEVGKRADLLLVDVPHYRRLVYEYGVDHVQLVIAGGRVVADHRSVPTGTARVDC
jgi:imidazolonepropionase